MRYWFLALAVLFVGQWVLLIVGGLWLALSKESSMSAVVSIFSERFASKGSDAHPEGDARLWTWDATVYGFADKHSVFPGETFNLMLAAHPGGPELQGRIEIFRVGYYGDDYRQLQWRSPPLTVPTRKVASSAASLGVDWPPMLPDIATDEWASGYYSVDFVAADGEVEKQVAYIVVKNPAMSGDVLLKLGTNTYQAYNAWGGHSLYESLHTSEKGQMVSFDRPTRSDFFRWEFFYVRWLEQVAQEEGFSIDFATDFDLHTDAEYARKYPLFVSFGHDEYWTKEMFDHVYERVFALGKNTLFLGANTAYWQMRYADVNRLPSSAAQGRQMVCFKSLDDPIGNDMDDGQLWLTAMFRDAARRPESMLMGVAYQSYFSAKDKSPRFPYVVKDTGLPFFEGTGYAPGDEVHSVIGYEWDNRDPDEDGKRLWDAEKSSIPAIPLDRIRVLFEGEPVDIAGKQGRAEAVYFESPTGAKVFSSGTIRWTWAIGKKGLEDDRFRQLNRNMVLHFLGRDTE